MTIRLELRQATLSDAPMLWHWRNDVETRNASHSSEPVDQARHLRWLRSVLRNKHRELLIAEESGVAVGTVRADRVGLAYEVSWTVAPNHRGRGVGKLMVTTLVDRLPNSSLQAQVKVGNHASVRIAQAVGMKCIREADGVMYFWRAAPLDGNRAACTQSDRQRSFHAPLDGDVLPYIDTANPPK